jgi:hypothetical protein
MQSVLAVAMQIVQHGYTPRRLDHDPGVSNLNHELAADVIFFLLMNKVKLLTSLPFSQKDSGVGLRLDYLATLSRVTCLPSLGPWRAPAKELDQFLAYIRPALRLHIGY